MKKYIFLLLVLLIVCCNKCDAQLGLFKYGTFYAGVGLNNSLNEANNRSKSILFNDSIV